jgi:hypothetical protein
MADTKITDLAAINAATVASTDLTVVVDVSDAAMAASGTDKKLTVADLATAVASIGALATDAEVTAAIGALSATYQPLDSDLTAIAALSTTSFGRGFLVLADAAGGRSALSLGTAATADTGTGAANVPTITQADARYQPLDSDLTAIAALTTTVFGRSLLALADAAAARTALGLVIGTNVQAYDGELAAIAGLTSAADRLPYFTGSGTASLATFTAAGRALVDDADAAAQRTTLGLAAIAASGSAADLGSGTVATARLGSGTANGTTFLRGDQTWATPSGGGGAVLPSFFGTGETGDATISSNTTLTADTYYNNLTVDAGVTLSTGGFRIFVAGTLTLNGTIAHNGSNGSNASGAAGAAKGTLGVSTTANGGNGSTAAGSNGNGLANNAFGGTGGAGGAAGSGGGAGGAAGVRTTMAADYGGYRALASLWQVFSKFTTDSNGTSRAGYHGGTGGGGGGGGASQSGGGGGGGGGVVIVCAKALAGTGTLQARGGNGANAQGGNAGGGGGGGGGCVVLVTAATSDPYTVDVAGGTGGTPLGTGVAGSDGAAGQSFDHLGVS